MPVVPSAADADVLGHGDLDMIDGSLLFQIGSKKRIREGSASRFCTVFAWKWSIRKIEPLNPNVENVDLSSGRLRRAQKASPRRPGASRPARRTSEAERLIAEPPAGTCRWNRQANQCCHPCPVRWQGPLTVAARASNAVSSVIAGPRTGSPVEQLGPTRPHELVREVLAHTPRRASLARVLIAVVPAGETDQCERRRSSPRLARSHAGTAPAGTDHR